jgi:hypothetical protein
MNSQRNLVMAAELAIGGGATERHAVYPDRRKRERRLDDVKQEPMRPAGVRKMRQSRKRRKPHGE